MILTTEKDAVRLEAHAAALADLPVYVLPVRMAILKDSEREFDGVVERYVKSGG